MFRHILVPVDFTKKNLRAVRTAVRLASDRGASVVLLHVIERVDAGDSRGLAGFYRKLETQAQRQLGGLVRAAAPVEARAEILYGNRVNEILRFAEAEKVDLIVMSHKVGILSRCPVLLVK